MNRKTMGLALVAVLGISSASGAGGQGNLTGSFKTSGPVIGQDADGNPITEPDRYADGTPVKEGEVYALVWIRKGLNANALFDVRGELVNTNDTSVIAKSVAREGHCAKKTFSKSKTEATYLINNGTFSICLLDTHRRARNDNGDVELGSGVDGYGVMGQSFTIKKVSTGNTLHAKEVTVTANTYTATTGIDSPRISSIDVNNGIVTLQVENTSSLVRYGVAAGRSPNRATMLSGQEKEGVEGVDNGTITMQVPVTAGQFFSVERESLTKKEAD